MRVRPTLDMAAIPEKTSVFTIAGSIKELIY